MPAIPHDKLPKFDTATLVVRLDGSKMRTLRAAYPRLSKALAFPADFGKNLDALFDSLCDLGGIDLKTKHVALVIDQGKEFLSKERVDRRADALQVFEDATQADNRYDERTFQFYTIA